MIITVLSWGILLGGTLFRPKIGGVRFGPMLASVVSVSLVLLFGIVKSESLAVAGEELYKPLLTISGIMVLTGVVRLSGALRNLCNYLFDAGLSTTRQFDIIFIASAILSTLLNNDAMILLIAPAVFINVIERWPNSPETHKAFAFAVIGAVGIAPQMVANPINLLASVQAGIGFNDYLLVMVPAALVCWVISWFILRLLFKRSLSEEGLRRPPEIISGKVLNTSQYLILGLVVSLIITYPFLCLYSNEYMHVATLSAAGIAILLVRNFSVRLLYRYISWDILVFLFAVFVLALASQNIGFVDSLIAFYDETGVLGVVPATAIGTLITNNHPMTLLNTLAFLEWEGSRTVHYFLAMAVGDVAPRILPSASLAGLLFLPLCRAYEINVGIRDFVRIGLISAVPAIVLSCIVILWLAAWSV